MTDTAKVRESQQPVYRGEKTASEKDQFFTAPLIQLSDCRGQCFVKVYSFLRGRKTVQRFARTSEKLQVNRFAKQDDFFCSSQMADFQKASGNTEQDGVQGGAKGKPKD